MTYVKGCNEGMHIHETNSTEIPKVADSTRAKTNGRNGENTTKLSGKASRGENRKGADRYRTESKKQGASNNRYSTAATRNNLYASLIDKALAVASAQGTNISTTCPSFKGRSNKNKGGRVVDGGSDEV